MTLAARLLPLLALACLACSANNGTSAADVTYSLTTSTEIPSVVDIGAELPIVLTVTTAQSGSSVPAPGAVVTATVISGQGSVLAASTLTADSVGRVVVRWMIGAVVGTQSLVVAPTHGTAVTISVNGRLPATHVAFATEPSSTAITGEPFLQQPVIQLKDAAEGNVAQAGVLVDIALTGSGTGLAGTLQATTDADGRATFTGLDIIDPAPAATLTVTAFLNGVTPAITPTPISATAAKFVIVTQPSTSVSSGALLAVQPVLQLQDGAGHDLHRGVVVSVIRAPGSAVAVIGGAGFVISDTTGRAVFTDISLTGSGVVTLRFLSTAHYLSADSSPIAIGP